MQYVTYSAQVRFTTVLGGSRNDFGVDSISLYYENQQAASAIFFTGYTFSSDVPLYHAYYFSPSSLSSYFFAAYSNSGKRLLSSYFFGDPFYPLHVNVDNETKSLLFCVTLSIDGISTDGTTPKRNDVLIASFNFIIASEINSNGSKESYVPLTLNYATYLGGSLEEDVFSCKLDGKGIMSIISLSKSSDFPVVNPLTPVSIQAPFYAFAALILFDSRGKFN